MCKTLLISLQKVTFYKQIPLLKIVKEHESDQYHVSQNNERLIQFFDL